MQRQLGNQVSGPEADAVALVEQRREEGQADDVVVMRVREEDVGFQGAVLAKLLADRPQARAGAEDQQLVAAVHLQAGGVVAVAQVAVACTGGRAAGCPEADTQICTVMTTSTLPYARHPFSHTEKRHIRKK